MRTPQEQSMACRWSVSVHLKRALTVLFRELELTFVQQLVQAVNLLGNCLLLDKLVILGALLWFRFPNDGPCSQGAVTETLLMLVAVVAVGLELLAVMERMMMRITMNSH